jgi:hypothetical protein
MKKLITFLIFGLIPVSFLSSNPILPPQAFISELKFDENNNWLLEVTFQYSTLYTKADFDSICISTSNGFSRLRLENIKDSIDLFVVTSDSLMTPLSINKEGDHIKLYSFLSQPLVTLVDSLNFGNYPGSTIDSIPMGYSIVRLFYDLFSKDKTPTIGLPNDTAGTCGIVKGYIYDKNENLVTKGNFILDNLISIQNDSSYSTSVYARKITFTHITNNYEPTKSQSIRIDTIRLNVNPDSIFNIDIHLLDDYIVGIKEKKYEADYDDIAIMNYPNPFNSSTIFKIKVPSSLQNKSGQINIYDTLGKRIFTINLSDNSRAIWNGKDFNGNTVSSGIYYYQLILENKIFKYGSMIVLK